MKVTAANTRLVKRKENAAAPFASAWRELSNRPDRNRKSNEQRSEFRARRFGLHIWGKAFKFKFKVSKFGQPFFVVIRATRKDGKGVRRPSRRTESKADAFIGYELTKTDSIGEFAAVNSDRLTATGNLFEPFEVAEQFKMNKSNVAADVDDDEPMVLNATTSNRFAEQTVIL